MPFTIATYNAYWLFDNEAPLKRWGLKLPDGGVQEKITLTAKELVGIGPKSPDIIALQEVEGKVVLEPLLEALRELDPAYKYYWCSETLDPFTGQNVAVISKCPAAIKPVTRLDQYTVDYVDHRERERVGSLGKFLRVDIEVDSNVLSVYVAHLKSRRGGIEQTRLLRDAQARILRDLTLPRIEQGNSRSPSFVAVVGDFNDVPKSSPLDIIQGKRDPSYNLESAIQNIPDEDKWTYIHKGKKEQLDHLLLSKFALDKVVDAGIARIRNEVSDHDAVWSTIDFGLESSV